VAAAVPQTLRFRLLEKALFQSHFSARYDKARDDRGLAASEVWPTEARYGGGWGG
jgi:hypothetical protein